MSAQRVGPIEAWPSNERAFCAGRNHVPYYYKSEDYGLNILMDAWGSPSNDNTYNNSINTEDNKQIVCRFALLGMGCVVRHRSVIEESRPLGWPLWTTKQPVGHIKVWPIKREWTRRGHKPVADRCCGTDRRLHMPKHMSTTSTNRATGHPLPNLGFALTLCCNDI